MKVNNDINEIATVISKITDNINEYNLLEKYREELTSKLCHDLFDVPKVLTVKIKSWETLLESYDPNGCNDNKLLIEGHWYSQDMFDKLPNDRTIEVYTKIHPFKPSTTLFYNWANNYNFVWELYDIPFTFGSIEEFISVNNN